jgi:hypothetical protein
VSSVAAPIGDVRARLRDFALSLPGAWEDSRLASDGALSTLGKACMKRCLPWRLASSIACAVAATAMPRPWNFGTTIHPTS